MMTGPLKKERGKSKICPDRLCQDMVWFIRESADNPARHRHYRRAMYSATKPQIHNDD